MTLKLMERCIYCYGDVCYHREDHYVKCPWCGQTLVVAKFENELARIMQTEEENVLVKQQLKEAEKEKQAAEDRLFAALSSLDSLEENQGDLLDNMKNLQEDAARKRLEEIQQLYRQAESFQLDRAFDKAEKYYRRAITKGCEEAEIYWRLIMCHYGLFYQKDDDGNQVPIILNPDLTDPDEMSLRRDLDKHLTARDRRHYQEELAKIDRILDKYRLLKDQVQYDVFISVKQSDGGHHTTDSDVASDLYDFLTGHGLRVFNSRRTIIPAGQEYEPYIISALISARAMIVVGTTPEYMNAQWVKNEWSRYQWLQRREKEQTGKTSRILICYLAKGMQAGQIPKALNPNKQAIFDGVKAHDELLVSLGFLLVHGSAMEPGGALGSGGASLPLGALGTQTSQQESFEAVDGQMTIWLLQGKYEKVLEKYDKLVDSGRFLNRLPLHLAALCAKKQVSSIEKVVCSDIILEETFEFMAAQHLCREEQEKGRLQELLDRNREWRLSQKKKEEDSKKIEQVPAEKNIKIVKASAAPKDETQKQNTKTKIQIQDVKAEAKTQDTKTESQAQAAKAKPRKQEEKAEPQELEDLVMQAHFYRRDGKMTESIELLKKAAGKGSAQAMWHLGIYYQYGDGVKKNRKTALKWFQKSAELGKVESWHLAAQLGESFVPDISRKQIADWYRIAADQGYAPAQAGLAKCYENGWGVLQDQVAAAHWYRLAAEGGYAEAQYLLAVFYERGVGVPQDAKKAAEWYEKAADQGNIDSIEKMGLLYENGIGVPKDRQQAYNWYKKMELKDHGRASYHLGRCYEEGIGVSGNPETAFKMYSFGTTLDPSNLDCKFRYGRCLLLGKGTAKNPQGIQYILESAQKGHPQAQEMVGQCYETGNGVSVNKKKAFQWYAKAAFHGLASAQYRTGWFLEHGIGTLKNKEEAKEWYQKAADQGHEDARKDLERLSRKGFASFFSRK